MNEIEKMYENAGLLYCNKCMHDSELDCIYMCENKYPSFTAERQLKILCFIVNNKHSVIFHDQIFGSNKLTFEKIQENLAWAVNRIWQDLTENEKEDVRGILRA